MRTWTVALAATVVVSSGAQGDGGQIDNPPGGFAVLFNGRDLSGWHARPPIDPRRLAALDAEERAKANSGWTRDAKEHWIIEDGALRDDGRGSSLTSDKDFGDIELRIDYQVAPRGAGAVALRGTPGVRICDHTDPSHFRNDGMPMVRSTAWSPPIGSSCVRSEGGTSRR